MICKISSNATKALTRGVHKLGALPHTVQAVVPLTSVSPKNLGVERSVALGESSVNTGTIPSKTLRETVLRSTRHRLPDLGLRNGTENQGFGVRNGYLDIFPLSFSGSTAVFSGRGDFFKLAATLCATLWVARRLPPKNLTLPSTTCSWTTWPSRVTN
jgi:hypothetical protein